jgi:iron complex transport system ATP-binding protein
VYGTVRTVVWELEAGNRLRLPDIDSDNFLHSGMETIWFSSQNAESIFMNTAVRFTNFSCSLGRRPVLCDISLSIEEGSFVAVVGRNGSGKSTPLKCALGIIRGDCGEVSLFERPVEKQSRLDIAKSAAMVPQTGSGRHPFTVFEYVRLSRFAYKSTVGRGGADDDEPVVSALSTVGMMKSADRYMDTLSGGENQKVQIAAALAQETPVILLDEPSAFLDYRSAFEIGRLLTDINRRQG